MRTYWDLMPLILVATACGKAPSATGFDSALLLTRQEVEVWTSSFLRSSASSGVYYAGSRDMVHFVVCSARGDDVVLSWRGDLLDGLTAMDLVSEKSGWQELVMKRPVIVGRQLVALQEARWRSQGVIAVGDPPIVVKMIDEGSRGFTRQVDVVAASQWLSRVEDCIMYGVVDVEQSQIGELRAACDSVAGSIFACFSGRWDVASPSEIECGARADVMCALLGAQSAADRLKVYADVAAERRACQGRLARTIARVKLLIEGDPGVARELYRRAAVAGDYEALRAWALMERSLGDRDQAMALYEEWRARAPEDLARTDEIGLWLIAR